MRAELSLINDKIKELIQKYFLNDLNFYKKEINLISYSKDEKEYVNNILKLYEAMEEKRKVEDEKNNFFTDTYKGYIKSFSIDLMKEIDYLLMDFTNDNTALLFSNPYISYASYRENKMSSLAFNADISKNAYLSLIKFFKNTTFRFTDNAEAIDLLLNNYPSEPFFTLNEKKLIAEVIQTHFLNCGFGKQKGFLFNGTSLIEQNINNLPTEIVELIINKYEFSRLLNSAQEQKQVETIIKSFSEFLKSDKKILKFNCCERIYIFDYLTSIFYFNSNTLGFFSFYNVQFEDKRIYYENLEWFEDNSTWVLYIHDEPLISFRLDDTYTYICIQLNREVFRLKFSLENWNLNEIFNSEIRKEIEDFISNNVYKDRPNINKTNSFEFSYLYLENYRSITQTEINFDHQYMFLRHSDKYEIQEQEERISKLYGNNIYSLSCLVGENGTGKTSAIHFLKYELLMFIQRIESNSDCLIEGLVDMEILSSEKTRFLVIFSLNGKNYYLTNIGDIFIEKEINLLPYQRRLINLFASWKMYYFSNSVNLYSEIDSDIKRNERLMNKDENNRKNNLMAQTFFDYSEMEYFDQIEQKKDTLEIITHFLNFLWDHTHNINQIARIQNRLYQEALKDLLEDFSFLFEIFSNKTKLNSNDAADILTIVSSGQLSKLVFLSKLYWCISDNAEKDNSFVRTKKNETSIIFIDEGELYYHPNWQRKFVFALLAFLNFEKDKKFQVILATNSPFFISDLLEEDIVYLNNLSQQNDIVKNLTFGQNIHTLLSSEFFMEYTIGEFSFWKIKSLIQIMNDFLKNKKSMTFVSMTINEFNLKENATDIEVFKFLEDFISEIGEDIYRAALLKKIEECKNIFFQNKQKSKNELIQERIEDYKVKIRELEELKGDQ